MDKLSKVIELLFHNVRLVISVMILVTCVSFISVYLGMGNMLGQRASDKHIMLDLARFSAYNGKPVGGDQVISAARQFSNKHNFYIYVQDSSGTFGVDVAGNGSACYTPNPTTGQTSASKNFTCSYRTVHLTTEGNRAFTRFNSVYDSTVLVDNSGIVTGLHFRKQ